MGSSHKSSGSQPVAIVELHSDNGSEFFNQHLLRFWKDKVTGVQLSRSRPYRKNDNRNALAKECHASAAVFRLDRGSSNTAPDWGTEELRIALQVGHDVVAGLETIRVHSWYEVANRWAILV